MPSKCRRRLRSGASAPPQDSDSDDSVDRYGNLRGLIDYDSDATRKVRRKKIDKTAKRKSAPVKRALPAVIPEEAPLPSCAPSRAPSVASVPSSVPSSIPSSRRTTPPSTPIRSDESSLVDQTETEEDSYSEEEEDEEDKDEDDEDDEEYDGEIDIEKLLSCFLLGKMAKTKKEPSLRKEPAHVKRFVKLLTAPLEEDGITEQISSFKALSTDRQNELLVALENRPTSTGGTFDLMLRILTLKLPKEIQATIFAKYTSLQNMDPTNNEYHKLRAWLDKVVTVPFGTYKEMPVRIEDGPDRCAAFMQSARSCLDAAVYGQEDTKLQVMQYICSKIANPTGRGMCLLLSGPPGVGKTTIIKNGIAKALGWPFQFISLGGDSDATTYTGHQLVYESSHCGKIVNSLVASKSMSTVLMFDEVDKISQTPRGEEVMNLLVHLTDPVQNGDFEDKYLAGVPIDLSRVMFVFSANDLSKIDRVLLDRMVVIELKGYDAKEKRVIAEQYLLPAALREVNLAEKVGLSRELIEDIIQNYAGEEKGVRELGRCLQQIAQKVNMLRMYNDPTLPFYIKDFTLPYMVKKDHVAKFVKKKVGDEVPHGMYL